MTKSYKSATICFLLVTALFALLAPQYTESEIRLATGLYGFCVVVWLTATYFEFSK